MSDIERQRCVTCSVDFGVPLGFIAARRVDGKTFHCPNGHPQSFRKSETDKLREEVAQKDDTIQRLRTLTQFNDGVRARFVRRVSAYRSVVSRMKARASLGLCPLCGKKMPRGLAHHVKEKHPTKESK